MGIKKTYYCELCGGDDFSRDIHGIKHTGDKVIFVVPKKDSNTHLCSCCMECIKSFQTPPSF